MRSKTCCFTGHRSIYEETEILKSRIKKEVVKLINENIIYFGTGGARGFDLLASQVIVELKQVYPQIKLILVLPCSDHFKGWR